MPFTSVQEFLDDWKYESEMTTKTFEELTDASLLQKVTPVGRSLGKIAWHITCTVSEMMSAAGLSFETIVDEKNIPTRAEDILDTYNSVNANFNAKLSNTWSDNSLSEAIPMYGETWLKSKVLSVLMMHQTHHRGQMTVLMRQAGLKVPGVYGPSYEEWGSYGAEPQE